LVGKTAPGVELVEQCVTLRYPLFFQHVGDELDGLRIVTLLAQQSNISFLVYRPGLISPG